MARRSTMPRQGGFTMAELLVAMLILAIMLTGLAALQLGTIRNVTDGQRYSGATRLAESVIARYQTSNVWAKSQPATSEWVIEPARSADPKGMRNVAVDGESPGPYTVQRLIEDLAGRRLITIRVTWLQTGVSTGDAGAGAYRLSSLMMSVERAL